MNRLRTTACCVCFLLVSSQQWAISQVQNDPISEHLKAKQFEEALQVAEDHPAARNRLLGRIALGQFDAGEANSAKDTLRRITDAGALTQATGQLRGANGGANGADFDTLMDLVTTTVAPDSWDEVGGPGAIESFPGGVYVDTKGVLRKAKPIKHRDVTRKLDFARKEMQKQLASDDPNRSSKRRMVSLNRLQRELQLRHSFGEAPTDAMRNLAGLQSIQYLFLFPETNDCVIAGPAGEQDDENAPLLLDDLLTLMKNAHEANGSFGCSITPKRANLAETKRFLSKPTGTLKPSQTKRWVNEIRSTLGLQNIQVGGIDPRSHVAHVLVEADYHMKLVGMGLEPSVPGVPSYLKSIEAKDIPVSMDVLRWWFTLKKNSMARNDQGDAFVFADQVVQLQSENELITDNGDRVHTGDSTVRNQAFANRFSKHYGQLAVEHPIYARLDGVFRLALVASLIQNDEVQSMINWSPSWMVSTLTAAKSKAPQEVPSIVNHRLINRRHVVVGVSGGVRVRTAGVLKRPTRIKDTGLVTSDQNSAKPRIARNSERWWWD